MHDTNPVDSVGAPKMQHPPPQRYTFRGRSAEDHNSRLCRFLTLPAEIRLRVFKNLFSGAIIHSDANLSACFCQAEFGVLLASQQCYLEGHPLFYQSAHIELDYDSYGQTSQVTEMMRKHACYVHVDGWKGFEVGAGTLAAFRSLKLVVIGNFPSRRVVVPGIDVGEAIEEYLQEWHERVRLDFRRCLDLTGLVLPNVVVKAQLEHRISSDRKQIDPVRHLLSF